MQDSLAQEMAGLQGQLDVETILDEWSSPQVERFLDPILHRVAVQIKEFG